MNFKISLPVSAQNKQVGIRHEDVSDTYASQGVLSSDVGVSGWGLGMPSFHSVVSLTEFCASGCLKWASSSFKLYFILQLFFHGTEDWTQGLLYARQVLYHWALSLASTSLLMWSVLWSYTLLHKAKVKWRVLDLTWEPWREDARCGDFCRHSSSLWVTSRPKLADYLMLVGLFVWASLVVVFGSNVQAG